MFSSRADIIHLQTSVETNKVSVLQSKMPKNPEALMQAIFHIDEAKCLALPNKNLTLLHVAAFYDSTECICELLDAGFLVDAISVDEYAPLHYAALSGSLEAAAVLLSHGADPNYAPKNFYLNIYYMTPLFLTARSGSAQIMNMLFDNKAKLDIKAKTSKYPLKETLRCGHIECFLILIERGVRPTASLDQRDYTPLMMAIRNDELHKAVPILLEHGANVNAMTKSGFSPLFLACRKRNLEIVQLLCNDPTLKLDITGQGDSAPIHWAAFSCVPEIVQLIIDRGALVTAKNKMGETAISEALRFAIHSKSEPDKREKDIFDMLETLKILVKNGLSVNDQRNQQNDKSTAIQNYLTRPDSIDIRILDFLFSNGFDYNIVVSTRPAEAVGDRIWDMRLPTDIHDFVQKKLLELGYKPKMK